MAPELRVVDAPVLKINAGVEHKTGHDCDLHYDEEHEHDCGEPNVNAPLALDHWSECVKCQHPVDPQETRTDAIAAAVP